MSYCKLREVTGNLSDGLYTIENSVILEMKILIRSIEADQLIAGHRTRQDFQHISL